MDAFSWGARSRADVDEPARAATQAGSDISDEESSSEESSSEEETTSESEFKIERKVCLFQTESVQQTADELI